MPSGLSLPLALGMYTRLIGSGRYLSSLSASAGFTQPPLWRIRSDVRKVLHSLHPAPPCWRGPGHRRAPGCLPGLANLVGTEKSIEAIAPALPPLSRVTPSAVSEHFSESIGYPISCPFLRSRVCLNQGPFTLHRRYPVSPGTAGLSRHPTAPACSLAASGWSSSHHAMGLPVLRASPLCTCCRPPRRSGWLHLSLTSPDASAFPHRRTGRPAHRPFRGLLSVHSRYGLHTRWMSSNVTRSIRGSSHFVTSMTAPIASGWSGSRVGLSPTGKRRLCTAHVESSPSGFAYRAIRPPRRGKHGEGGGAAKRALPDPVHTSGFRIVSTSMEQRSRHQRGLGPRTSARSRTPSKAATRLGPLGPGTAWIWLRSC